MLPLFHSKCMLSRHVQCCLIQGPQGPAGDMGQNGTVGYPGEKVRIA